MTQSPSASIVHEPGVGPPHPPGHAVRRQSQLGVPPHAAGSELHDGGGSGGHPEHPFGQKPASADGAGQMPGPRGYSQKRADPHAGVQSCVIV
jgi:hypothetical protein